MDENSTGNERIRGRREKAGEQYGLCERKGLCEKDYIWFVVLEGKTIVFLILTHRRGKNEIFIGMLFPLKHYCH